MLPWEYKFEVELICPFTQPSIATKRDLVLEKRYKTIAVVSASLPCPARSEDCIVMAITFARTVWGLVDLRVPVQAHNNMRNTERLRHLQNNTPGYDVSRPVHPMWIVWLYEEVGVQPSLGTKRLLQPVDERRF